MIWSLTKLTFGTTLLGIGVLLMLEKNIKKPPSQAASGGEQRGPEEAVFISA
jgi:hypothetical protein